MDYDKHFRVKPGSKVKLKDIDPDFTGKHEKEEDAIEATQRNTLKLAELQERLYAEHKRSLLICLQAVDAGGKDGTIKHVMGAMNPQGCKVAAFKQPTNLEKDHDFMWRANRDLPAKGEITIFNRSHYEDVLAAPIHDLVPKHVWSQRYDQINTMERYWCENNTHVLKFFLHIGKDEQLKRFKERLDDPTKHWKISENDYAERKRWSDYREAFEDMLSRCSTKPAPWFVIPANHKWFRNLSVSQIVVNYLEGLDMQYPKPSVDIKKIRKEYQQASRKG